MRNHTFGQNSNDGSGHRRSYPHLRFASIFVSLCAAMFLFPALPAAGAENSGAVNTAGKSSGAENTGTVRTVKTDGAAAGAADENRRIVFVGDSRTVGMYITLSGAGYSEDINASLGNEVYIGRVAMGFDWFAGTGMAEAEPWMEQGNTDLVILMGCNDMGSPVSSANRYAEYVNANADSWSRDGNRVFFDSVNPVGHRNGGAETSSSVYSNDGTCAPFNDTLRNALSDKVTWIDSYSSLLSGGYATVDGIHYDGGTYQAIHDYIRNAVSEAEKREYTAVFDAAGGTCPVKEKKIREGESLTDLPVPEKEGYVFSGWSLNGNGMTDQTDMPSENITLTASWKASDHTPYQVIFHCGSEADDVETRYGTTGEKVTVNAPAKDGYKTPDAQTGVISADGTTKFDFHYTPLTYSLTIHAGKGVGLNGGSVPGSQKSGDRERSFTIRCTFGDEVSLLASEERGYKDLKITGDLPDALPGNEADGADFRMPDHDVEITMSAEPVVYHIRYTPGVYSIAGLPETYTVEDLPLRLKKPATPFWASFGFWTDENGREVRTITEAERGDLTLTGEVFDYRAAVAADVAGILLMVILGVLIQMKNRKRK